MCPECGELIKVADIQAFRSGDPELGGRVTTRRVFNRGYRTSTPSRYSSQHRTLAKVVTMNATCVLAHLGGCDGPLEADHIVPQAWGGASTIENLRPLCRRHNRQRGGSTRRR